jgi:hypothetical protein
MGKRNSTSKRSGKQNDGGGEMRRAAFASGESEKSELDAARAARASPELTV